MPVDAHTGALARRVVVPLEPHTGVLAGWLMSRVGASSTVSSAVSLSGPQGPSGSLVVSVNVTCPAARSAWLGQYRASMVSALGRKLPVPLDVQWPLVA